MRRATEGSSMRVGMNASALDAVLTRVEHSAARRVPQVEPQSVRVCVEHEAVGSGVRPVGLDRSEPPRAPVPAVLTWGARAAHGHAADAAAARAVAAQAPSMPVAEGRVELEDAMWTRLEGLGLIGALGDRVEDQWTQGSEHGGEECVARLRKQLQRRLTAVWDLGRMGTMAVWWEDFLRHSRRVPFMPLRVAGELGPAIYNAQTLELFAAFMREKGSRVKGKEGCAITAEHIGAIVATVRIARSQQAHYEIAPGDVCNVLPNVLKRMRAEDGTQGGDRRESRGFRARDFRAVMHSVDRQTPVGIMEWGVALAAWALLLRGCEVGRPTGKAFDPARGITMVCVTVGEPGPASQGLPWGTVDVTAAKDVHMRHRAIAVPLRQRSAAGDSDPLCAYSAILRILARREREVPACAGPCAWCKRATGTLRPAGRPPATCARANAPLFTRRDGRAYETKDVDRLGSCLAAAAGIPAAKVGGKLWRIGGTTDLWEALGEERSKSHIKRRGRWKSDIWEVYQRVLLGEQLNAAAGMADAHDDDMEAVLPGWVQPAGIM